MRRSQAYGITCAAFASALVVLLLLLVSFYPPEPDPLQEGMMISFGDSDNGGGSSSEMPDGTQPATPAQADPAPSPDNLLAQEDEPAPAVEKPTEQPKKTRQTADAEELKHKQREAAEAEARKKAEEARIAREEQAKANAARMGGLLSGGRSQGSGGHADDEQGSGNSKGSNREGNPAGHGTEGDHSWSLEGRDIKGSLPKPNNSFSQEGKITVDIRVDAAGNVISATIGRGTTISDRTQQNKAKEAAMKAKFSKGDGPVVGTITYNYKVN